MILGYPVGKFEFQGMTGDMDGDGDEDLDDYDIFAECLAGPEVTTAPGSCTATQFDSSDLTGDVDVDLADFGRFVHAIVP